MDSKATPNLATVTHWRMRAEQAEDRLAKIHDLAEDVHYDPHEKPAFKIAEILILSEGAMTKSALFMEVRADGWPLCPFCGHDELWSNEIPATQETIVRCLYCNWEPQ